MERNFPKNNKSSELSLCVLASGSKGNSVYISDGTTAILIDAGLSGKEIERRMKSRELRPEALNAILVSHEHSDHIKGVGVLSRRYGLPVYISRKTFASAEAYLGNIKHLVHFQCGMEFHIDTLTIRPFSTSHDSADPAGFRICAHGIPIGIATDLGIATSMVQQHLKQCALLVLESNHDPDMLITGPYPWPLKQRIKGRTGHLSNEESMELLLELVHDGLEHVILAHLSEQNNSPDLVMENARRVLDASGYSQIQLSVATQDTCSEVMTLKQPLHDYSHKKTG